MTEIETEQVLTISTAVVRARRETERADVTERSTIRKDVTESALR